MLNELAENKHKTVLEERINNQTKVIKGDTIPTQVTDHITRCTRLRGAWGYTPCGQPRV